MTWNRWYTVRSYVRSSLWVVPFFAMVLEQIVLETRPEWRHAALRCELELLDQAIDRLYPSGEDRAMARVPDM